MLVEFVVLQECSWKRGHASNILAARSMFPTAEPFLIVMSDHLFDRRLISNLTVRSAPRRARGGAHASQSVRLALGVVRRARVRSHVLAPAECRRGCPCRRQSGASRLVAARSLHHLLQERPLPLTCEGEPVGGCPAAPHRQATARTIRPCARGRCAKLTSRPPHELVQVLKGSDGRISRLGKKLSSFDALEAGAYVVCARTLGSLGAPIHHSRATARDSAPAHTALQAANSFK
eukprot:scaffold56081_cov27-Tisochrysis_lutea.AAC.9